MHEGEQLFTMSQAVRQSGVSEASIRNYTSGRFAAYYVDFLSPTARPGTGQPRQLTAQDIQLLRYIHARTRQGATHEVIKGEIAAGAVADFTPPEVSARQAQETRRAERAEIQAETEPPPAALVAVQEVARQLAGVIAGQLADAQAANAGLAREVLDAEKRAAAADREAEILRAQIEQLRGELVQLRNRGVVARLLNRG